MGNLTITRLINGSTRTLFACIFFTGDLVNNESSETDMHLETYKMLKAPYGVYSCLGNHDYGDYKQWETPEAKEKNLQNLKDVHRDSGWRLLMNEHVPIEKDGQKIALLGIENWGGNLLAHPNAKGRVIIIF